METASKVLKNQMSQNYIMGLPFSVEDQKIRRVIKEAYKAGFEKAEGRLPLVKKPSHKIIITKIVKYLNSSGAEHLRFWQALYNMNIVSKIDIGRVNEFRIKDDHNISDKKLIERLRE